VGEAVECGQNLVTAPAAISPHTAELDDHPGVFQDSQCSRGRGFADAEFPADVCGVGDGPARETIENRCGRRTSAWGQQAVPALGDASDFGDEDPPTLLPLVTPTPARDS
jgi:hypothetical protein